MLIDFLEQKQRQLAQKGEIYLRIKVQPKTSQTKFKEILADETIKVDIAAQPRRGQANQELIKFLAKYFLVGKENIRIISGKKERLKLVKVVK